MSTGTKTMPEPSNPIINKEWVANLENYLDQANLDGAFEYIAKLPPENLEQHFDPQLGPLLSLRARCLVCEVYDYAGKSREANLAIDAVAEDIWEDLKAAEPTKAKVWKNIEKLTYLKQECLACLHLGMVCITENTTTRMHSDCLAWPNRYCLASTAMILQFLQWDRWPELIIVSDWPRESSTNSTTRVDISAKQ